MATKKELKGAKAAMETAKSDLIGANERVYGLPEVVAARETYDKVLKGAIK
jgi:hypothetical protein